jgi:hypothetical protein
MVNPEDLLANMIKNSQTNLQETVKGAINNLSASGMCQSIIDIINNFESNLDNQFEAGVRLVSFGQTVQFYVSNIEYQNPNLIIFSGYLDDSSPVRLVQHMSQLSILLTVLPRKNPDVPRRKIGFSLTDQDE